jgi:uncharacterized damage-inducible protein DinB
MIYIERAAPVALFYFYLHCMNKETQALIKNFETTLNGQPWFGRAVYEILEEVDESKVQTKPGGTEHSMLELLWHMNTWAEFTLANLENRSAEDLRAIEENDWRTIDTGVHTWQKGLEYLKTIHKNIETILSKKEDEFLNQTVPGRQFNFRFMLNGLVQHNIYHLGQIAYLKKLLV